MTQKRNKFLNFCFSMLPGAGHMFMGFMKQGVSIMALFFGTIAMASFLNFDALVFAAFIIWFYAFFDSMNKNSLSDEAFANVKDHVLFVNGDQDVQAEFYEKYKTAIGIVVIIVGVVLLLRNSYLIFDHMEMEFFSTILGQFLRYAPPVIFSLLIIGVGIFMIVGKKKKLDMEEDVASTVAEDEIEIAPQITKEEK